MARIGECAMTEKNRFLKKAAALLLAGVMLCGLAGCDRSKASDADPDSAASGLQSTSNHSAPVSSHKNTITEEFEYNGTFNKEVFEHICRNIVIEDKTLSLPFTIKNMGEGFSYNDVYTYYDEKLGLASAGWTYNGNIIGYFTAVSKSNDSDWSDNLICSFDVQQDEYEQQSEFKHISIGGMELMDTKDELVGALGQPTEKTEFSSGTVMYSYLVSEDNNVRFDISPEGKITVISITISHVLE